MLCDVRSRLVSFLFVLILRARAGLTLSVGSAADVVYRDDLISPPGGGGGCGFFFFFMAKGLKTPAHVLKTHVRRMSYGGGGRL